jgi:hypothetical protein
MDRGQLAMERQLGRCLVTVRAASSEASVLGTVPAMVLTMGSPPPRRGLTRGALTVDRRRELRRQWRLGFGSIFAKITAQWLAYL